METATLTIPSPFKHVGDPGHLHAVQGDVVQSAIPNEDLLAGPCQRELALALAQFLDPGEPAPPFAAFDSNGEPITPPADHLLASLTWTFGLLPDEVLASGEEPGTIAVVGDLPACDRCRASARYDLLMPFEWLCASCSVASGRTTLGPDHGYLMVIADEVPDRVRAMVDGVCEEQGSRYLWAA